MSKMETGHAWVEINELHDNVQLKHITPAEAMVVRRQFGYKIKGQAKPTNPITHLDVHKNPIERTQEEEYARLVKKYGETLISAVFPGDSYTNIPVDFKSAGFEATPEKAPTAGKAAEVIPLEKLSKEEVTDEESLVEAMRRKAQESKIEVLQEQVSKLTQLISSLQLSTKLVEPEALVVKSSTSANPVANKATTS